MDALPLTWIWNRFIARPWPAMNSWNWSDSIASRRSALVLGAADRELFVFLLVSGSTMALVVTSVGTVVAVVSSEGGMVSSANRWYGPVGRSRKTKTRRMMPCLFGLCR